LDNSMAVDLSEEAVELKISSKYDLNAKQRKDRTVFIVITGDRDMLPAVRKVLECGIRVELWGWKSGMAKEYLKERNGNALLSVNFLDNIFSEVSFTNYRSTRNTRVNPAQTIVLCEPDNSIGETWDDSSVAKRLLQLGRLFYTTRSKTETEIFVEFPRVKNIDAIMHQAQELFDTEISIISWPNYTSRSNKDYPIMVETSNMFAPLENEESRSLPCNNTMEKTQCLHESNTELGDSPKSDSRYTEVQETKNRGNDPDDDGGWQRVQPRSHPGRAHAVVMRRSQRCPRGQHCVAKGECGYMHTDKELSRFRENPKLDFSRWKTKSCTKDWCRKGESCPFAHSRQEAWCLSCRDTGHFTEECKTINL
ncbi:hypothetical protein LZ31DRAFT_480417, partial [Colletotrichum somersetense]